MRIDELYKKFSDSTLKRMLGLLIVIDILKRIGMKYCTDDTRDKDCDGIPKRPTMYLNLWSYKVVRHRYSNPMIQPEPEGSTQGYPLDSVEVLRFDTSAGNPVNEILLKLNLPDHRSILRDLKGLSSPGWSCPFSKKPDDVSGYIVGISKPSIKEPEIEALKTTLYKVDAHPDSVVAWEGGDFIEEKTMGNTNVKKCVRKVVDRHFIAAVKVLSSSGVAPYSEIDCVLGCIKSFPKGTSCGIDGLRVQHILDALCEEGSATATDLLKSITSVVNLWLAGRCQSILAEFVASAPLTPLLKPDNGIRPIAYGVGVSGGAEAVLHSANRVLSEYHNDGSLAMLTVDFSNAFNLVDRLALLHEVRVRCPSISLWVDFLYGQATRLYIGDTHIWSPTGVQQGDPLGPLLFALVLHPLIHKIRDSYKLLLHAWYLNDGTVISDLEEVSRVLDIIKVSGLGLGLELNIKKIEIFWPSCNGTKIRDGLFPVDIRRLSLGVKLLGGAVNRDADFISGLAMRRATDAVDLMSLLLQTCQPVYMEEAALFFDKGLRGSIENIVVCGGPFFGDLQWSLASLPIRIGGLDLYSAKVVSFYAFVALRAQPWVLQDHILRDSGICGMDDDYVFAFACLRDAIPSFDFNVFTNKETAPSKPQ
ncbi:putative reverse transcriptase domain-containing protein [Tanacetum coccineum]